VPERHASENAALFRETGAHLLDGWRIYTMNCSIMNKTHVLTSQTTVHVSTSHTTVLQIHVSTSYTIALSMGEWVSKWWSATCATRCGIFSKKCVIILQ
jgi:hypothetical protein